MHCSQSCGTIPTLCARSRLRFGRLAPRVRDRVTAKLKGRQIPGYGRLATDADGDFVFRPSVHRLTPSELAKRTQYSLAMQSMQRIWETGDVFFARRCSRGNGKSQDKKTCAGFEWFYGWKRAHNERSSLVPSIAAVNGVAYSPDGKLFAIAGSTVKAVRVYDADSGKEIFAPEAPYRSQQCHLEPDRRTNCLNRVSDREGQQGQTKAHRGNQALRSRTGRDHRTLETDVVFRAAFSHDGKHIAAVTFSKRTDNETVSEVDLLGGGDREKSVCGHSHGGMGPHCL